MPPLGIGYLLAVLKRRFPRDTFTFHMSIDELIDAKPDLVCLSSATENFTQTESTARRVKEALGSPVMVGGMHITVLPHTLPDCFDVGVIGEGEEVVCELIEAFGAGRFEASDLARIKGIAYRDEGRVAVENTWRMIDPLDALPHPDRDALGQDWAIPFSREVHLCASRGCPYKCSFCSSAGVKARRFSPEYVVDEVAAMRAKCDPEQVFFYDDLFVADRKYFRRVCELLTERGLHEDVVFRSYARANLVDDELADLFESINLRYVDFGFESNCATTLGYLGKSGVTPEINQRAIDVLRDRDVSIGGNFIIGSPDETVDDMNETREFVRRNANALDRVSMGPLLAIPGTRVWNEALERGLVSESMDDWTRLSIDPDDWGYDRYPLLSKTMSASELNDYFQSFRADCDAINDRGARRRLEDDATFREQRAAKLRSELDTVRGSRLVRGALAVRRFVQSLTGRSDKPK